MANKPGRVIVGMPAFNEEKYIGSVILQARQYADEVIVADDGSLDDTVAVAEMAGAHVVRHTQNSGYGMAIRSLLATALERGADVLVILDADGQHRPAEIPALVEAVGAGSDLVIGSRTMRDNVIPAYRRFGQKVLSTMTRVASRRKLSDTESGFRGYSRRALEELELKETGMAVSSEIVSAAAAAGLKITEVPVSVLYTGDGSTLNPVQHGVSVLNRILVMISERRPLFFFSIIGAFFIAAGIALGVIVVQILQAQQVLQVGSALISMLLITVGVLSISTGLILNVISRHLDRLLK